jgi:galactokinase/mevalonate kinase-like predicted kinase
MIITRSPMRISLGGGGTDLPSYYREFGGFLIAAAIDMLFFERPMERGLVLSGGFNTALLRARFMLQNNHNFRRTGF